MSADPSTLSLAASSNGEVKIIRLLSEQVLPFGDDALARELEANLDDNTVRHLFLDFAKVRWITSAELGMLVLLHKRLAARGGRLTLFNLGEEIYEVFTVTRLHTLLEVGRMS
jgi:anti-anti-sigma factor